MFVGAAIVELHLHGCQSLKQKRGIVRSIVGRVRNRFNVSVAEVGGQDKWQRCQLGLSAAARDAPGARKVLDRATTYVEDLHLAEVLSVDIEVVDLPHHEAALAFDEEGSPLRQGDGDDGDWDEPV